jgi:26S proteasome regulatory subunit N7
VEDSKEREGEIEVRDHILDKAKFLKNDAMDYPAAEKVFREALEKTGGASRKMEILFEILIMNMEKLDTESVKKDIATCKQLVTDGADWDKKNKLKIFEGAYFMMIRDFDSASKNFMSSTATFTCTELMEYKDFAFYAVVCSTMTQDRATLRKNIIHSPDILAVIREIPYLRQFSDSLFHCDYKSFF